MTTRVFRIFLSSTFGDFQIERETLRKNVWPKLEAYCRARSGAFQVVDLRWGISHEDGVSQDTLRICLDEIGHCQRLTPKPNFVMLIGDKYGWRPLPPEIPNEEFAILQASLADTPDDLQLLKTWYRRDDNAVPPHYRLLPREGKFSSPEAWSLIETRLSKMLRRTALALGLNDERRRLYFLSATHLEIQQGALSVPDPHERVFAFIRRIEALDSVCIHQPALAGRYTDLKEGHPDTEAAQLREELRTQVIRAIPPHHHFDYTCQWNGFDDEPITTTHLAHLCEDVERCLLEVIDRELGTASSDPLDLERQRHMDFAEERRTIFIGREVELRQFGHWLDGTLAVAKTPEPNAGGTLDATNGATPLIVHGPGGVGKSAFMAQALSNLHEIHPQAVVIQRYVGVSPGSADLASFLRNLLLELARQYGRPEILPEGELKALIDELAVRLTWATAEKPLVVAVDALDQFHDRFEVRTHLWLPADLPPYVAVVMSMLDGPAFHAAKRRYLMATTLALPHFTLNEAGDCLDALLMAGEDIAPQRKRRLSAEQRAAVLEAFAVDGKPLYLKLALAFMRGWHSWTEPEPLPGSLEGLIGKMIERLQARHGTAIAGRALAYLGASRFGVSDEELRDLLWRDEEAKVDFDHRKRPSQPDVDSLPPVIWSRLYFELAPYLTGLNIDGAQLHRYFHRVIAEEVGRACLAGNEELIHAHLARYFESQSLYLGEGTNRTPNLRKIMEEAWQWILAGELDKAEGLITNFDYAMAKCEANRFNALLSDCQFLMAKLRERGAKPSPALATWEDFLRSKAHILRRGNDEWPSHKILLQLAIEHADDSPITLAAEMFLSDGKCTWSWLHNSKRPTRYIPDPCLAVMEGHTDSIKGAEVLADGRLLSWSQDSTIRLWDEQTGEALVVMEGHSDLVDNVKVLPNGQLMSWSKDSTIRLWDKQTGEALAVMEGHSDWVTNVKVLPNGRLLSISVDNTLRIWDENTGQALAVMEGHSGWVNDVKVLSDEILLSWSHDNTIRIWDAITGQALSLMEVDSELLGVEVLIDGRMVTCSSDNKVRIWDTNTGQALVEMVGHTGPVNGVIVLSDQLLLSWSKDNTLRTWDANTGQALAVMEGHTSMVNRVYMLPDRRLLSCSDDNSIRIWNGQTGLPLTVMNGHADYVRNVELISDGRLLSWSIDKSIRLWNGQTGELLAVMEGHTGSVRGVKILSDGCLLSWSDDQTLRIWDGQTGEALALIEGHTDSINGVILLPDGLLLSWSDDSTLRLWDIQTEKTWADMEGRAGPVLGVTVLQDGRLLSWSNDNTLRIWDANTGQALAVMEGHTGSVNSVKVLSDGRLLAWSNDNTIRIWDANTGQVLAVMDGHTDSINGAEVLADGRLLSWSDDSTLRLWDGQTGEALAVMEGHSDSVNKVKVLPNGRLLSWSYDNTIRLWDEQTGEALAVMEGHQDWVRNVKVLPNGRLLSWSFDNTLRLWDIHTGMQLAIFEGHTALVLGAEILSGGRMLSRSLEPTLRLWNVHTGEALAVMEGHTGSVRGVEILSDGRLLSWSGDQTLRIWDAHTYEALAVLAEHEGPVNGVKILSDRCLLSWSGDHTLRIWDVHTNKALAVMEGHNDYVVGVDVLTDGNILSWSHQDAILWNDQGRQLARLSTKGQGLFRNPAEISQLATKLGAATTNGHSAWLKMNCVAWIEHDSQTMVFWQSDVNTNQKIHSINTNGCLLSNTTGFTYLQMWHPASTLMI